MSLKRQFHAFGLAAALAAAPALAGAAGLASIEAPADAAGPALKALAWSPRNPARELQDGALCAARRQGLPD
jgi:hypothetical protein